MAVLGAARSSTSYTTFTCLSEKRSYTEHNHTRKHHHAAGLDRLSLPRRPSHLAVVISRRLRSCPLQDFTGMAPCRCRCRRAAATAGGARALAPPPPRRVPKRGKVLKRAFKGLLAWLALPRLGWWLSRRGRCRAKGAAAATASRLG
jgi:hypothetical protein